MMAVISPVFMLMRRGPMLARCVHIARVHRVPRRCYGPPYGPLYYGKGAVSSRKDPVSVSFLSGNRRRL